ncbi:MAG: calcium/sodium antiporter [Bacteroidetes bacterium]|nr:calcium/sodium antiporter [Bacteroidota bacterium]MDA1336677.1 calcium/sodium antiporter [Bacteroidota bacterium]
MEFILLIGGLVALVLSGDYLVKFASGLALKIKIPPVIIGLTVVSIGTSAPEIIASVRAALEGNPGITMGNVIGSNIANLALILGVTSLIHPIRVDQSLMKVDWPTLILASLLFWGMSLDGELSKTEGMVLILGALVLLSMLFLRSKKARDTQVIAELSEEELEQSHRPMAILLGGIALASVGLYYGSEWFIEGARQMAINFGIGDHIIGLTVVAFGTSVPELVASGIAAWRREPDLALGNLIGSNIFNIFFAAGISSSIIALPVDAQALDFDFWWMTGIAIAVGIMMMHRKRVDRWKGSLLLLTYLVYVYWIGSTLFIVNPA